jgi:hypothetical protein
MISRRLNVASSTGRMRPWCRRCISTPRCSPYLTARAQARGVTLSELVNTLLKKDIELIEAAE